MIRTIVVSSCLLFAASAFAQSSQVPSVIHVAPESEVKDLAQGYARSFGLMKHVPITLVTQKEGVVRIIEDVRTVRESEGVLVVEVGKGFTYLVNPKDIVVLTDGPDSKPKPEASGR